MSKKEYFIYYDQIYAIFFAVKSILNREMKISCNNLFHRLSYECKSSLIDQDFFSF